MRVSFDEATHTYWHGDKEVPGVTSILKAIGLSKDYSNVDTFYRDRGVAVALAIELFLKGTLDEKTIDPVILPYWEGFKRYWDKHAEKPVFIEEHLGHERLWFAGKADLVTEQRIVDWKVSKSYDKVSGLQGEGYKTIFGLMPFRIVQFPGEGKFEIFEYDDKAETWPHVIAVYNWVRKTYPRKKING